MSGPVARDAHDVVAGAEEGRAERVRILTTLLEQVDTLTQQAVTAIRAEIPAYAAQGEEFFEDVVNQVSRHFCTMLHSLIEERTVTLEDIAFVRGAATRRARAGFGLEDYINAFRVGQQVFWERVVECAGTAAAGREAALSLAASLMQYCDFASTHAGRAYVEFQQYAVADADRERRDLLERILGGDVPAPGPLLGTARAHGITADSRMMLVAAIPASDCWQADAAHLASAAIAGARLHQPKTLAAVRQGEIVAVPVLAPGVDPVDSCDRLSALQQRLSREGIPLAMGISTVATGVAELPRAYAEAHAALECVPSEGGVAALPRLSPLEYLAMRADDTAWHMVDPRLRAFLHEDRARGGVLAATIRAFAQADLNLRVAAGLLRVHPNTAKYRLRRVEQRTGRNPRHIADLIQLLLAITLDGRPAYR